MDNGLTLAATVSDGALKDSANAFVYDQNPRRFNEEKQPNYISSGQVMDLFIAAQMRAFRDSVVLPEKEKKLKKSFKFSLILSKSSSATFILLFKVDIIVFSLVLDRE